MNIICGIGIDLLKSDDYKILRLAAFSEADQGGNPAGVVICDELPDPATMLAIAEDLDYSETAFACPLNDDQTHWKVRYYSPKIEVPFCGHATIALTVALAKHTQNTSFTFALKEAKITTTASIKNDDIAASIISPQPTFHTAETSVVSEFLELFGLTPDKLNQELPPAMIDAGAPHFMIALKHRHDLAAMHYDMNKGLALMNKHGFITVMLVFCQSPSLFHVRNAFAAGGLFEDPATGAAAAAFTGYVHALTSSDITQLTLIQGEDMGMKSIIHTKLGRHKDGVTVSGNVRTI